MNWDVKNLAAENYHLPNRVFMEKAAQCSTLFACVEIQTFTVSFLLQSTAPTDHFSRAVKCFFMQWDGLHVIKSRAKMNQQACFQRLRAHGKERAQEQELRPWLCHTTGNTSPGLAIVGGGPWFQGKYAPQQWMPWRTVKPQMNRSIRNASMSRRMVEWGPCQRS